VIVTRRAETAGVERPSGKDPWPRLVETVHGLLQEGDQGLVVRVEAGLSAGTSARFHLRVKGSNLEIPKCCKLASVMAQYLGLFFIADSP